MQNRSVNTAITVWAVCVGCVAVDSWIAHDESLLFLHE